MCLKLPTRTVSSTLLLVLLTSALFISIYSIAVPTPAQAAGYVGDVTFSSSSLLPNVGPPGTWVTFHGVLNPTPSGGYSFTCNLTASHPNFFSPLTGTAVAGKTVWTSCNVIGADVIGSFKVRDTPEISTSFQLPGLNYTINLQVTANNSTRQVVAGGLAFFKVTPKIGFSHTGSTPWYSSLVVLSTETVYVHGWGFNATSSTCSFTSKPTSFTSIATAPACSISAGELTNGQFTLIGGAATTQSINATGNTGDPTINYGAGSLGIVSAGTAIQATPKYGTPGMTVTVTGVGFSSSDTSCVLSYMNLTYGQLFSSTSTCTLVTVGTWKQPTVTFTVADTATANINYTLRVMGFPTNDYAYTYFRLNASYPAIALIPNTGLPGTAVSVTNSTKFSPGSAGLCTITTTPTSPALISSYVCLIKPDGGLSSFTKLYVSYSTPGQAYVVTITGTSGDHASAAFLATTGPTITLNPTSGSGGDSIQVSGVKFSLGDTTCNIAQGTPNATALNAIQSYLCSVSSGTVTGSFVIKTLDTPAGVYNITVFGNTGDKAYAWLAVTPKIALSPSTARVGDNVTVSGSNFAAADANKVINFYSVPGGAVNDTGSLWRHRGWVNSHYVLTANSSFIVASNPTLSSYVITGSFTTPASATLTITPRAVLLSPDHGPRSTWVNVTGTGFSTSDTSCVITGSGVVSSPTCSISDGTITGKFQVLSTATLGTHSVNVTGIPWYDRKTSSFLITPAITLTPNSGHPGTIVAVLGSGFDALDTSCAISSSPSGLISNPTCAVGGGNVAGSFTAASGATGPYLVIVTGSSLDAGSAPFNRATPTLTLSQTSGVTGTVVTGSGGNYLGTSCMLTALPSNLFTSQACAIVAGSLTASFTVASGASGGYTVWAQTNAGIGDSASGTFTVTGVTTTMTTVTSTSTATTTPTTTATTTVQTTSSVVSTSTTTSVVTSTGPWVPPKCVIATATFGSEVSPAVQFLRGFRDRLVLSTRAGSAFMEVFNAWYYSFSPSVARFIADNDPLRAPVRVVLYPLLGVLGISALTYSMFSWSPEFAVVMAGLVASSLIGLVYLTLPAVVGFNALAKRRRIRITSVAKVSLTALTIALGLLVAGELAGLFLLLAVASSAIVLACIITVPAIVALAVLRPNSK